MDCSCSGAACGCAGGATHRVITSGAVTYTFDSDAWSSGERAGADLRLFVNWGQRRG